MISQQSIAVTSGAIIVDYLLQREWTIIGASILYHFMVLIAALVVVTIKATDSAAYVAALVMQPIKLYSLVMLGVVESYRAFLLGFLVCLSLGILGERERLRIVIQVVKRSLSPRPPKRHVKTEEEEVAGLM